MSERAPRSASLRWSLIAIAALLFVGGLLLEASAPEADRRAPLGGEQALREVAVLRVDATPLRARAEVAGVLEPRRTVLLFSETHGAVTRIGAEKLDFVESGLVLVEIDPLLAEVAVERARAAVTRSRSELALARANLERRSSLADRGVASTAALDDAENAEAVAAAALREASAQLTRARDDLAKKVIRAPFDGTLRSFEVEVGEYVRVGQRLGELLDGSTARITIGLSDRDVVAVERGQPAAVRLDAYPGESFVGEVLRVGRASDPSTKKFPVEVEIPNPSGRLLPGMVGTVALELGTAEPRILIPRDATLDEFGLRSVYVIEPAAGGPTVGFTTHRRRVEVRHVPFRPAEFEVVDGLVRGELIAVGATRQLRDGEAVRFDSAGLQ